MALEPTTRQHTYQHLDFNAAVSDVEIGTLSLTSPNFVKSFLNDFCFRYHDSVAFPCLFTSNQKCVQAALFFVQQTWSRSLCDCPHAHVIYHKTVSNGWTGERRTQDCLCMRIRGCCSGCPWQLTELLSDRMFTQLLLADPHCRKWALKSSKIITLLNTTRLERTCLNMCVMVLTYLLLFICFFVIL